MTEAYTIFLCHFVGDYFTQSDWMALNKNKKTIPCLVHVILYTLCFVPFLSFNALLFVAITHFIIDRFGIVKYLIWLKNHINPTMTYHPWSQCSITGYQDQEIIDSSKPEGQNKTPPQRPFWLTLMLYIVSDNTLHLICNEFARTHL